MRTCLLMLLVTLSVAVLTDYSQASESPAGMFTQESHRRAIEDWHARRIKSLKNPNGYLAQVGLDWLKEGENRIGSAEQNDIRLSAGPAYWGSVFLDGDEIRFERPADNDVLINGESLESIEMVADIQGKPTIISRGDLSFYAIFRESYALRVKDRHSKDLREFHGVDNYPTDESWRITGDFVRAEEGTSIEIVNVLGQVNESPVYGSFEFERDGKIHKLLTIGSEESEDLWIIFADRTSGHGTYGAGRFLYSEAMPVDGRLTVDFNKAYNPPCAFNDFSTCPLPPQANRLDLLVMSGEKDYHSASGGH